MICLIAAPLLLSQVVEVRKAGQASFPIQLVTDEKLYIVADTEFQEQQGYSTKDFWTSWEENRHTIIFSANIPNTGVGLPGE